MTRVKLVVGTAITAFLSVLVALSGSCHRLSEPLSELLAAPETIMVASRACTLATGLWRNFEPAEAPPDGWPLRAFAILCFWDTTARPPGVTADRIWVIKSDSEIWEARLALSDYESSPNELWSEAKNGPKWGPGIYVDVVVRVRDSERRQYLLRAVHQRISRIE